MRLFKNLKARILKSFITWSEMGKQTAQAKEVYLTFINLSTYRLRADKKTFIQKKPLYSSKLKQFIPV